jgi:hypothetical protein
VWLTTNVEGALQRLHICSPACWNAPNAAAASRLFPAVAEIEQIRDMDVRRTQRGNAVCTNGLLVRRAELERQLLGGLRERVLHAEVVDYTLKRFEEEIAKALVARSKDGDDLRRQERTIANQLRGLADGYSPSITAAIGTLEVQLADL